MSQETVAAKSVTFRDIARKAGVSTATVSRVLNGEGIVKEETRERVMTVLLKENYSLNSHASALGRLSGSSRRKKSHRSDYREAIYRKMAIADVLDGIKSGTETAAYLIREFSRLRQSVEALARSSEIDE